MKKTPPELDPIEAPERGPLVTLVRGLIDDTALLFRQEIALAKVEIRQNVRKLIGNVSKLAVGGGVALFGVVVFVAFLIIALGLLLGGAYWLAALIVAVLLLAGGGGLAYMGAKDFAEQSVAPQETIESLKTTQAWASHEVGEFGSALRGERRAVTAGRRLSDRGDSDIHIVKGDSSRASSRGSSSPLPLSKPLYKRVFHEISDDDILGRGAQVAYFMFTSLPPALLVVFALSSIFGGAQLGDYIANQLQAALPGSADDPDSAAGFIRTFVDQVVQESAPGPLSIGLLLGIWAASAVFVALTEALNRAYDIEEDRSWFKRRSLAIAVMIGFMALFLLGSIVLIAGPQIAAAINLGGAVDLLWSILQWPLAFMLVVGAFYLVYYFLPNRDQKGYGRVLLKSSAIAAALFVVATLGFRLYIANFGSFSETYGFVGAILVLLLWMYITGIVILVGGEISSEMEREA